MKAGIIFTGTGPIVILTSYDSLSDQGLLEKLTAKGIRKFVAYEVPVDLCRDRYGEHFSTVLEDLRQTDDLRVLDFDGHHVYSTFSFSEYGVESRHE